MRNEPKNKKGVLFMTKKQFLEELREALRGEIAESEIKANLEYYNDYITESTQKGRNEQQIFEEIGNPQWIARTIIDSYEKSGKNSRSEYNETVYEDKESSYYREDKKEQRKRKWMEKFTKYTINGFPWYYKIFGILLLILVLLIVFYVGAFIFSVVVGIAVPALIIYGIWKIFFKKY